VAPEPVWNSSRAGARRGFSRVISGSCQGPWRAASSALRVRRKQGEADLIFKTPCDKGRVQSAARWSPSRLTSGFEALPPRK